VKELLGLFDGIVELFSVLLGNSVLEILSLSSGLVLGRSVSVGLGLGRASLLVGSASDLVLLLSERGVGVSRVVEVLSVRLQGILGLALVLLLLLLELLLLLLSLVVCLASGSRVALSVDDPGCQWRSSEGQVKDLLGVTGVILGVVSDLRSTGTLELELGGLVGSNSLAVGTDPLFAGSLLVGLV
jgi:hypothetical protein